MHTLFGLKSSDRLPSHIGNFDCFANKNLFVIPLSCAAKVSVILEWCFVSEASIRSTLRSCASRSGRYRGHKRSILQEPSLHFTPDLQSSVCTLAPVCSLRFAQTDINSKKVDHMKSRLTT